MKIVTIPKDDMTNLRDNICVLIFVSGRVQGVGFRFFTYQKAHKLHLTGYVKNLASGEVEIVACGQKKRVDSLIKWLNDGGPDSADIKGYRVKNILPNKSYIGFSVRY